MYSISFGYLANLLLDEIMLRRLEVGGVDNFDTGDCEMPEESDIEDFAGASIDGVSVGILKGRLQKLLDANNRMEYLRIAGVDNWTWYDESLKAQPNAVDLLDRFDIFDIRDMLEIAAKG